MQALVPVLRCYYSHFAFRCPRMLRSPSMSIPAYPSSPRYHRGLTLSINLTFSRSTGCDIECQCCASAPLLLAAGLPLSGLVLSPQPWTRLLTTGPTGHRKWEQEYGHLPYLHHIVLDLDEVVHTVTKELNTCDLTTAFIFPCLSLDVNSSRIHCLMTFFSVLVCRLL